MRFGADRQLEDLRIENTIRGAVHPNANNTAGEQHTGAAALTDCTLLLMGCTLLAAADGLHTVRCC